MHNFWDHFGLHFGVILGAQFATILLLGRPGGQKRVTKERVKQREKQVKFWVPAGGGRGQLRWTWSPGMRLVTFGVETEVSLERGAFSGFPEYLLR